MGTWVLDVGVRNPGKHFFSLRQHLLGSRVQVGKNLNRNTGITDKRRDLLDNLLVLGFLFLRAQALTRREQVSNLRVLGNQRWIRRLTIYEAQKLFDL